jgi:hypothetical protein
MQIPKEQILDLLRSQGQHDKADEAAKKLPDQVDHERDSDLLAQHGIDPKDLIGKLGGKFGL